MSVLGAAVLVNTWYARAVPVPVVKAGHPAPLVMPGERTPDCMGKIQPGRQPGKVSGWPHWPPQSFGTRWL